MQVLFGRITRRWVVALATGIALVGAMTLITYWLGGLAALIIAVAGIALALVVFVLWWFPPRQAARAGDITPKERVQLENELRKTIAEAIGGAIVIAGLAFTWLQLDATRDEQQLAREQQQAASTQAADAQAFTHEEQQTAAAQVAAGQALTLAGQQNAVTAAAADRELARQGQLTERLTDAVNQLGSDQMQVRIGALHALDHLAQDSPDHVPAVLEVMAAFVRERAPWPIPAGTPTPGPDADGRYAPPADVQETVLLLGRGLWIAPQRAGGAASTDSPLTPTAGPPGGPTPTPDPELRKLGCLNLNRTDLRGARLVGSFPIPLCLGDATLAGADLTDADLRGAYLYRADLTGAYLAGVNLGCLDRDDGPRLCAYLVGADLTGAVLPRANLAGADLARAVLTDATLADADLTGANLRGAGPASGVSLRRARLPGADLRGADLTGANFAGAVLPRADLTGADLTGAYLGDARLVDADLPNANLTDAGLPSAVLTGADLRGANLTRADLTFAVMWNANLAGADFRDAVTSNTILTGADLTGVQNMTQAQSDAAIGAPTPTPSPGVRPPATPGAPATGTPTS